MGRLDLRWLVVSAAAMALTAGCSSVSDKVAEEASEQVAEQLAEAGGGGDVDVELDSEDGSFTMESGDGTSFSVGVGELPEGWPSELLALPEDAEIQGSSSMDFGMGENLSVTYATAAASQEAVDQLTGGLADGGFEELSSLVADGSVTEQWGDGERIVTLIATPSEDGSGGTIVNASYGADPEAG